MKHYLALAVRVLSITLFLYSIIVFNKFLHSYSADHIYALKPHILIASLNFFLPLILAIVFWTFPQLVTKKIYNGDDEHEPLKSIPLLAATIAAIGIFYFYYALSDTMYWAVIMSTFSFQGNSYMSESTQMEYIGNIIVTTFELVMALILIFKCKTIAKFISKVSS